MILSQFSFEWKPICVNRPDKLPSQLFTEAHPPSQSACQQDRTFLFFCLTLCLRIVWDLGVGPSVTDLLNFCVCSWQNSLVSSQRPQDARQVQPVGAKRQTNIFRRKFECLGWLVYSLNTGTLFVFYSVLRKQTDYMRFYYDLMWQLMKLTLFMFRGFWFFFFTSAVHRWPTYVSVKNIVNILY